MWYKNYPLYLLVLFAGVRPNAPRSVAHRRDAPRLLINPVKSPRSNAPSSQTPPPPVHSYHSPSHSLPHSAFGLSKYRISATRQLTP